MVFFQVSERKKEAREGLVGIGFAVGVVGVAAASIEGEREKERERAKRGRPYLGGRCAGRPSRMCLCVSALLCRRFVESGRRSQHTGERRESVACPFT